MKLHLEFDDGDVKTMDIDKGLLKLNSYIKNHKLATLLVLLMIEVLIIGMSILFGEVYNDYTYLLMNLLGIKYGIIVLAIIIPFVKIRKLVIKKRS